MSNQSLDTFYSLTPDIILQHVEKALGNQCTGRTFSLNSYENRVLEIDLEEEHKLEFPNVAIHPKKIVAKFYRPQRWTDAQLLEEHQFVQDLCDNDLPIIPALTLQNNSTLDQIPESEIYFCLYPKVLGRNEPEVNIDSLKILFRMLARIHQVGERKKFNSRPTLDQAFGQTNLQIILECTYLPPDLKKSYEVFANLIINLLSTLLKNAKRFRIHGDCHLGNVLWNKTSPTIYDFDDSKTGPAVQDLWVIRSTLSATDAKECLDAYQSIRSIDPVELKMSELLRGYRIIAFSAWIAKRWEDPIFKRTFGYFVTPDYWQRELNFLREITSSSAE